MAKSKLSLHRGLVHLSSTVTLTREEDGRYFVTEDDPWDESEFKIYEVTREEASSLVRERRKH